MDQWDIIFGAIIAIFFGLAVWWGIAQWEECREVGLSVFYCIQHIT